MRIIALTLLCSAAACGQGPSFTDNSGSKSSSSGQPSGDAAAAGAEQGLNGDDASSTEGDATGAEGGEAGEGEGADGGGGDTSGEPVDVPEATPEDMDAINRCLKSWKDSPFGGEVQNFKHIFASVTVGSTGNAVSDTERTDEPWLILITAGVNVLGTPKYELLNPNGWYCIKVNVNVMTELAIDLHCNARLADSKVNVNVGSSQSDATSAVGVHVLSTVTVNDVRPSGDACIR
jgi:hypothetical protein